MSHPFARVMLAFAACAAVSACADSPASRPPSGDHLEEDSTSGGFLLARGDDVLLRLPPEAFVVGLVEGLSDALNYDPFYLDSFDISWRPGRSIEAIGEGRWALDLQGGGRATLEMAKVAEGRYSGRLTPEQATGGSEGDVAFLRLAPRVNPHEAFYGLGSALDSPEHRGRTRAMQLEAMLGTVDSGANEVHVPVPLLIGTEGWGLFVEDPHPGLFEVAVARDDEVVVTFGTGKRSDNGLAFHLYVADHPLDVTRHYYETTGYPLLPARWALGPWIWRDENEDQAQVLEDLRTIRALDLATSGYWIDRPYASGVNSFDFDPDMFDDPAGMIASAQDLGFRVALWHAPYLAADQVPDLHAEAQRLGFFPETNQPSLNKWGLPLDFTNPDAVAWWQERLRPYMDLGIEGFKLDYAEDVVTGFGQGRMPWAFADGSDELIQQSQYQRHYHRTYAEMLPEEGGFLLCRAGTYGAQTQASVIWPGDLDATLKRHQDPAEDDGVPYSATGGLPASIVLALSLGPSGFPLYGSDTGGYRHAPPDRETFIRWFQQTSVSTVMQVGTNTNDVPWEFRAENGFDAESLDLYRHFARLHLRLWPYLWTYARRVAQDGRPIMRALGLAHPELGVHPEFEYLLGDHLYAAPVVDRGARTRTLHLPPGRWAHWFTAAVHEGPGEIRVDAPLDSLPLFLREGGIVPLLRPTIDTLAPTTETPAEVDSYATHGPGTLHVRVFPSTTPSSFTLFDGATVTQRVEEDRLIVQWSPGQEFRDGLEVETISWTGPVTVVAAP